MAERVKKDIGLSQEGVKAAVEKYGQEEVQRQFRERGLIEDASITPVPDNKPTEETVTDVSGEPQKEQAQLGEKPEVLEWLPEKAKKITSPKQIKTDLSTGKSTEVDTGKTVTGGDAQIKRKVSDKYSQEELKNIADKNLASGKITQEAYNKAMGILPTVGSDRKEEEKPQIKTVLPTVEEKKEEPVDLVEQKRLEDEDFTKRTLQFDELLASGASQEDLTAFARDNQDLKGYMKVSYKKYLNNKQTLDFVNTYNTANNQVLTDALSNKDIVIGSKEYNALDAATKERIQEINELNTSTQKIDFTQDNTKVISFSDILAEMKKLYSTDIRKTIEDMNNDPELTQTRTDLEGLQNQITDLDDSIEYSLDEIQEQYPNLPKSAQQALLGRRNKDLIRQKNALVNQYNAKLGTYSDMKNDIQTEIELLKYEDAEQKQIYTEALKMYETRRAEMREQDRYDLIEKNKALAEGRALDNAKELYEYQQSLQTGSIKGSWEDRADGLYFLKDDGTATKVIDGGITTKDGITTLTGINDKGELWVKTYDVNGNGYGPETSSKITQTISGYLNAQDGDILPSKFGTKYNDNGGMQCGEYVNSIFGKEVGVNMGDSWQNKLDYATEDAGGLGSIAVWQVDPNNKEASKYGHAGFIVGETEDGLSWKIKSSNFNGKGVITVQDVLKSTVEGYKNTSLFAPDGPSYDEAQTKFLETIDITEGLSKEDKLSIKTLGLTEQDVYAFKAENIPDELTNKFKNILERLNKLKGSDGQYESAIGFNEVVGFGWQKLFDVGEQDYIGGTDAADYAEDLKTLLANITIDNLSLMSGVLTDKDIEILKSAGTSLNQQMSEDKFIEEVKSLEKIYKKGLGMTVTDATDLFYTDANGVEYTKETFKQSLYDDIKSGRRTLEETQKILKDLGLNIN